MMSKQPELEKTSLVIEAAESADVAARLGAEIATRFGPREEAPLGVVVRNGAGALIGGLNGVTHWRWLYIRHVWVTESLRGQGVARRLIDSAERAARARGAIGAYIDTFDPRVAGLYEWLGYVRFGEIAEFPTVGGRRIYLSKRFVCEEGEAASVPSLSLPP
jgi:GNAT superfamily N-acetyltransferase